MLTYQEHLGVTYITLNEDPCPRMLIENRCPVPLLLKENVKGKQHPKSLDIMTSLVFCCVFFRLYMLDQLLYIRSELT